VETFPEAEAEVESWGRARRRPSPEAKAKAEAWGRARGEAKTFSRGRGLRSGEAELLVAPEAELVGDHDSVLPWWLAQ
jgi:hypothetical protein